MDFLREAQWLIWVAAALVLGVVEVATLDLVFAMFTVAALAAATVAVLGQGFTVQVLVFAGVSFVLLLVARPLLLRRFMVSVKTSATNVHALVGRSADVLVAVGPRAGQVKLHGETWSARTDEPGEIPIGAVVHVVRIEGATAVVSITASPTTAEAGTDPEGGTP